MAMRSKTGVSPMGKTYSIREEQGGDMAALAAHVQRTARSPQQAREELMRLVQQIPDEDLNKFIGAQLTVVS